MIEDVLKDLRAQLRSFLPAALDVEDAEYSAADIVEFGAAFPLEDVGTADYYFSLASEPQNTPFIRLLPQGTDTQPLFTAQAFLRHVIRIEAFVADTNARRQPFRAYRMGEAIRRVVSQRVEAGAESFQVDESGAEWDLVLPFGGSLVMGCAVIVRCDEQEDRP